MSKIWVKARVRAKDGNVARFESWSAELVAKVASDPGTLAFMISPTDVKGEYVVLELYKDSTSALGHLANVAPLLERMGDLAELTGGPLEVYGDISDDLRAAYSGWGPMIHGTVAQY